MLKKADKITAKSSFTHLLITQFNLDYSNFSNLKYNCDDEWHKERIELFNQFCLPSVSQQTSQNFKWIIFFNQEERSQYAHFLEETQESLNNIEFVFVKPIQNYKSLLGEYIQENIDSDYLITTRMDNDDSISHYFIEAIQSKFFEFKETKEDFIINPGIGYQYEIKFPYRKALISDYKFCPFISVCSKKKSCVEYRIVTERKHLDWEGHIFSVELSKIPLWTQVIHTKNRANRVLSLQLLHQIPDQHFRLFKHLPKNNSSLGVLLLFIQYPITLYQRVLEKVKKMTRYYLAE